MSFKDDKRVPYANLHLHSTHSDGVYSPSELVKIAKEEGYKALAITDHDVASAYDELKSACEREGMDCIFGVEFTVSEPFPFHIVGFDFDPEYPPMKEYLDKQAERQTYNTFMCFNEAVEKGNINGITWDEVIAFNKGIPWKCNNHVWRAMKAKGLVVESQYMGWFNENFKKQRAKYNNGEKFLDLYGLVKLIKDAGGIAICAHPCLDNGLEHLQLLLDAGIDGLEVLHSKMTNDDIERAYNFCIEHDLFISGGSDHSGLCGGYYSSYPSEEELKVSSHYIPALTYGVYEEFYKELKTKIKNRN